MRTNNATETIPVYIKGTDKVLQAEPAPGNHLNSLKREIIDAARTAIQNASTLAITTIADLMQNSDNDMCRLNAAKEILAMAGITRALDIGSDSPEALKKEREEMAFWDLWVP